MFRPSLFRAAALVASTAASYFPILAQDPLPTSLVFRFAEAPAEHLEKAIYENLRGLDPACSIHFDRSAARMDLRSNSTFTPAVFIEALASIAGLPVHAIEHSATMSTPEGLDALPGFPEYLETGDEAEDDLRYQEAKRAWISAHPEEYRTAVSPQQ